MQVCQDMFEHLQTESDLLCRVITGDETWIFKYDTEIRHQSDQWTSSTSPKPKKARQSKSKDMLITFFDKRFISHCEFWPWGQMINQQVYKKILRCMVRSVHEQRWELWQDKLWLLHHDNAPAHNGQSIHQFLAESNTAVMEQPLYSFGLQVNFFFFPSSKGSSRRPLLKVWRPPRKP